MDFVVAIKCLGHGHAKPVTIRMILLRSMDAVEDFFSNFGRVYHGRRCAQHSHDALIPTLVGVKERRTQQ